MGAGSYGLKPLDKAKNLLKGLQWQKRALSYNPYSTFRTEQRGDVQIKPRKIQKERKTR